MSQEGYDARGPLDAYGQPIMPPPTWSPGSTSPPPSPPSPPTSPPPSPPVSPPPSPPPPITPAVIDRNTNFRAVMDCGLETWTEEHDRLNSPIPAIQQEACYATAGEWASQMLASGVKETELGKTASGHNNWLNLFVYDGSGPADFTSWDACAKEWKRRFSDPTYKDGVYMPMDAPIEQIIATYQGGPGCWQTNGDSCAHGETWQPCLSGSIELSIQQFCARTNTFMGLPQDVPWSPVPGGAGCADVPDTGLDKPKIWKLPQDAARFGISTSCANTLINNCFAGRSGYQPTGIFLHVQEGTTPGSLGWWCDGPGVQASATVMANQDGSILQVVKESDGPWTNGDVSNPTQRGQRFIQSCGGGNPNIFSLTVETEGYWNQAHSTAQIDSIAWQVQDWMQRYDLMCKDVYAHRDINQTSRPNCCGSTIYNAVMQRLGCPNRW